MPWLTRVLVLAATLALAAPAGAAYHPIATDLAGKTIELTGHDLTIQQVVEVARHGARVELSASARQREADNYGLLLEAAAEGIAVYGFNRGAGDQRETQLFSGDPTLPANKAYLEARGTRTFRSGVTAGYGPEIMDEEVVRALMVVRANAMTHNAPSPQLAQMLTDLLNKRVTPVVQSRGTVGEGDLAQLTNVAATMVGAGEAYYQGVRMSAQEALAKAGLKPIQPSGADDSALISSDAYATAVAALVVEDARRALQWADLIYAMDLSGMNSSITPLTAVVQRDRPFRWLNWDAAHVLALLRGSYLFADDPKRIIQDPESLRASSIRQAAAWQSWAALRATVVLQMNSSDHNPAVRTDLTPQDSWELATPQVMKYHVKGGPLSHGKQGYVLSNANWDPYPLANQLEAFVIALANMDLVVSLRVDRFNNPLFTVTTPAQVLHGSDAARANAAARDWGYTPVDLQQEVQSLMAPVAPSGAAIVSAVEDLQAQTRIKAAKARQAVATTFDLLAYDLLTATFWMELRKLQDPARGFGEAPTAALAAFRKVVPLESAPDEPQTQSAVALAASFLQATAAASFDPTNVPMPLSDQDCPTC